MSERARGRINRRQLVVGAVAGASAAALAGPAASVAARGEGPAGGSPWGKAEARAELNREALRRTDRVLRAWLRVVDPETGLVPQEYDGHRWTVANAAADLYSSLVMHASLVDRPAMNGVLRRAIATERKHAQRIGRLPDDLNVKTLRFLAEEPSLARSMYGASEWCRDGLLRITEILGPGTPWSERLVELADEIMERAQVPSPSGRLPGGIEVCGEMLQTLSRLHAMTGDKKYRAWAERIGDHYLLERPPQKSHRLRLRDHGGEIVSGLAELYAMTSRADQDKAARYRGPLRDLLDRVLAVGRAPDGMLYDVIDGSGGFYLPHAQANCRSIMNVPFRLANADLDAPFLDEAAGVGLASLKGHRSVGGCRASIYNAMPVEGVEALRDFMLDFAKKNA